MALVSAAARDPTNFDSAREVRSGRSCQELMNHDVGPFCADPFWCARRDNVSRKGHDRVMRVVVLDACLEFGHWVSLCVVCIVDSAKELVMLFF